MYQHLDSPDYWAGRYEAGTARWDLGRVSPPMQAYADQLADRSLRVLVPGAGNGYEAEYFFRLGFPHVHVLDIATPPLEQFRRRVPDFPAGQVLQDDFFRHRGQYDLILEQTFFCAFDPRPARRQAYAEQMARLLAPGGKLVGLWWSFPLDPERVRPPFGGDRSEYLTYFRPHFRVHTFEPCYNSAPERAGKEFFGIFIRTEQSKTKHYA